MQWEFIVALVIAIPIILFPAAFVWYVNIGSIFSHAKEAVRKRKVIREDKAGAAAEAQPVKMDVP